MASPVKTCVICRRHTSEKLISFTTQTLQKCTEVLQIRQNNELKFKDVILPSAVDTPDGYHAKCYKSFTAVMSKYTKKTKLTENRQKTEKTASSTKNDQKSEETSSSSTENIQKPENKQSPSSSSSSPRNETQNEENPQENASACFFCNKKKKKYKGSMETLRNGNKNSIKAIVTAYSTAVEDSDVLQKFNELTTTKIAYHNSCKTWYYNKGKQSVKKPETSWHATRNYHKTAYEEMCSFIDENVLNKGQCFYLNSLYNRYMESLKRIAEEHDDCYDNVFTAQHLEAKIVSSFGDRVKVVRVGHKNVIADISRDSFDDVDVALMEEAENEQT